MKPGAHILGLLPYEVNNEIANSLILGSLPDVFQWLSGFASDDMNRAFIETDLGQTKFFSELGEAAFRNQVFFDSSFSFQGCENMDFIGYDRGLAALREGAGSLLFPFSE